MSREATTQYLEADVRCYHCGHDSGVLRRDCDNPRVTTLFRDHAGTTWVIVKHLTDLRCGRCRGPVYADSFEIRQEYGLVDLEHERRRRGRPPRWLVEQRLVEGRDAR